MTEEEKELQIHAEIEVKYAEIEAWERFKQEVKILKMYQFKKEQLQNHIDIVYND